MPKIKKKKKKTARTPTEIALFKTNRRLDSIETIIGMDDENWPLPENVTATTPLGLVLLELGNHIPAFINYLKKQADQWKRTTKTNSESHSEQIATKKPKTSS